MSEYKLVCDIALDNERFRVWGFAGKESADMAALKEFIIGFRQSVENGEKGSVLFVTPEKREEIVRCRYCKHYDRMNDDEGMCMVPDDDGDYARWMVDAVGYCYLGEMRGE